MIRIGITSALGFLNDFLPRSGIDEIAWRWPPRSFTIGVSFRAGVCLLVGTSRTHCPSRIDVPTSAGKPRLTFLLRVSHDMSVAQRVVHKNAGTWQAAPCWKGRVSHQQAPKPKHPKR